MAHRLKWLSHSGWQITAANGSVYLIDPWLSQNPVAPLKIEDLPQAAYVLLTHDHGDHAGDAVAVTKHTGATLVGQPETVGRYNKAGAEKVLGMNIGGSVDLGGVIVTMVDAYHSSETGTPAGYVLSFDDGKVLYHAGDTGLHCNMATWGELFTIDVALLPIGGHYTMDGRQAAKALRMLKPKKVLPMHYKTFPVLAATADDFLREAAREAPQTEVVVIEAGQDIEF